MTDIWSFTCPLCKEFSSHGGEMKIGNRTRWICVKCQKKIREEKKKKDEIKELLWEKGKPASFYYKDWRVIPILEVIKILEQKEQEK
jgi:hypothetical protein